MPRPPGRLALLVLAVALALVHPSAGLRSSQSPATLDVIYVPTPYPVVKEMLSMAKVGPKDVVFDLGSGDGRIVIAAVKEFHAARGVGVELDPQRIAEARRRADEEGVSDRVEFMERDLFEVDLSDATVVTLYLLPALNQRLLPTLRSLRQGTRIVSHNYDFGPGWKPAQTKVVERNLIHLWRVPRH
ncbi:MAG: cyclopropane-fatty-acyl-phospholipid synthase family protein [Vicinamibacterales bacterium]